MLFAFLRYRPRGRSQRRQQGTRGGDYSSAVVFMNVEHRHITLFVTCLLRELQYQTRQPGHRRGSRDCGRLGLLQVRHEKKDQFFCTMCLTVRKNGRITPVTERQYHRSFYSCPGCSAFSSQIARKMRHFCLPRVLHSRTFLCNKHCVPR